MARIVVRHGEESKIRREVRALNSELFKPVYTRAKKQLAEVLEDTNSFYKKHADWRDAEFSGNPLPHFPSNIIAFCGERGTGKSSTMMSFADSIIEDEKIGALLADVLPKESDSTLTNIVKSAHAVVLPVIDPLQMEAAQDLITTVLTRIMQQTHAKAAADSRNNEYSTRTKERSNEYRKVLDNLQKCSRVLADMAMPKSQSRDDDYEDSAGHIIRRGEAADLRTHFFLTVQAYLKYMCKGDDIERKLLVICTDDLDLNIKNAAEIIDHMQRYLTVPNVVVLTALKLEQMQWIIEDARRGEAFIRENDHVGFKSKECYDISINYLEKVIPARRRISMPDILENSDIKLCYTKADAEYYKTHCVKEQDGVCCECNVKDCTNAIINSYRSDPNNPKKALTDYNMRDVLLTFLYRKTGLCMPPTFSGETNYLMPRTMRELTELLSFLGSLPDVRMDRITVKKNEEKTEKSEETIEKENSDERAKLRTNLTEFESFFIDNWARRYLGRTGNESTENWRLTVGRLIDLHKAANLRKHRFAKEMIGKQLDADNHPDGTMSGDLPSANTLSNVFESLKLLSDDKASERSYKTAFAINVLYSTSMFKMWLDKQDKSKQEYGFDEFVGGYIYEFPEFQQVSATIPDALLTKLNDTNLKLSASMATAKYFDATEPPHPRCMSMFFWQDVIYDHKPYEERLVELARKEEDEIERAEIARAEIARAEGKLAEREFNAQAFDEEDDDADLELSEIVRDMLERDRIELIEKMNAEEARAEEARTELKLAKEKLESEEPSGTVAEVAAKPYYNRPTNEV